MTIEELNWQMILNHARSKFGLGGDWALCVGRGLLVPVGMAATG